MIHLKSASADINADTALPGLDEVLQIHVTLVTLSVRHIAQQAIKVAIFTNIGLIRSSLQPVVPFGESSGRAEERDHPGDRSTNEG